MPKKPNYGFDKRRKELERQKKKDAKIQARRERAAAADAEKASAPETGDTAQGGSQLPQA